MSAYDEAIDAMRAAGTDECEVLLRAIPDNVLVRLAIERGALKARTLAEWWELSDDEITNDDVLYRLVKDI